MGLFDFILGNKKRSIEKNNPSEQFDQSVTDELVKIIIDDETITKTSICLNEDDRREFFD